MLTGPTFQAKIPSRSGVYVKGGGSYRPWQRAKGPRTKELRNIVHSMSITLDTRKYTFESQHWLRFHISFIMTRYCKMRQLFYYKMQQKIITNCSRFSLQNATVLLQNALVITRCDDFITKHNSCYKYVGTNRVRNRVVNYGISCIP